MSECQCKTETVDSKNAVAGQLLKHHKYHLYNINILTYIYIDHTSVKKIRDCRTVRSVFSQSCVGNLSPAMGARNQVSIGLSYRTASLFGLATQFQTQFLE